MWLADFEGPCTPASASLEHRHPHSHRRRGRARGPATAPHTPEPGNATLSIVPAHDASRNSSAAALGADSVSSSSGNESSTRGSDDHSVIEDRLVKDEVAVDTPQQFCHGGEQVPELTGEWVDHPAPNHTGLYDPLEQCPGFARDFACVQPYAPARADPDLHAREFRKVFRAHQCALRAWDAIGFDACLASRRLVMAGDSLMRQSFQSLGCLLAPVVTDGVSADWRNVPPELEHSDAEDADRNGTSVPGYIAPPAERRAYSVRAEDGSVINATADWFGNITLTNGAQVHMRNFGWFHLQLWDDMLADLQPLTASDVLLVNFGAWYGRFNWDARKYGLWERWKRDVNELFYQRLVDVKARIIWKSYVPTHFGGVTGTFTKVEEQLAGDPRVPPRTHCEPASVGEFWYDDYVKALLHECGARCSHISFLPVFDLSLARHNSHHGSFGRGKGDDRITDCRHFCNNVVDVWNVVLYNFMCFA